MAQHADREIEDRWLDRDEHAVERQQLARARAVQQVFGDVGKLHGTAAGSFDGRITGASNQSSWAGLP